MIIDEMTPVEGFHVDINRKCNAKCKICYYRFSTWDCKDTKKRETWQKDPNKVKQEIVAGVNRGCKYVNFTGGEPTIHPNIVDFVKFSIDRKIEPIIITNGLVPPSNFYELIGAGCKHFLLSVHGLKEAHDKLVQVPGAYDKQMELMNIFNSKNIYWRANCVISKLNYKDLPKIAEAFLEKKVKVVNFIGLNLYYDEWKTGVMDDIFVKYSESAKYLMKAIDILREKNVWVNVRYFPMCLLRPEYRQHIVNQPQVMFDGGKESREWDYSVWPKDTIVYNDHSRRMQHGIYHQEGKCGMCGIRDVCGGLNKNYFKLIGEDEITSQRTKSHYPFFYKRQYTTDIVIPAYRMEAKISRLISEIIHKTQPPYNIRIVNQNQSAATNRNIGLHGNADYIIMCDDDIAELPYGWNRKLVEPLIADNSIMAISARLMTEDGRIGLNSANNIDLKKELIDVEMIPTACCVFRRRDLEWCETIKVEDEDVKSLEDVRFDERMQGAGYEDTDFFRQLRTACETEGKGTRIIINNQVKVVHLNEEKEGFGTQLGKYNCTLFRNKWLEGKK